jgi:membrane protein implicated in regulation of membrane protease activity
MRGDSALAYRVGHWIRLVLAGILLGLLLSHAYGVSRDFIASIRYPFGLDYGEGIVWQQAALIPGPRMYSDSPDLPFIVFHYPPLYHLLVRAALSIQPSFLAAGRLVSSLSAVLIALSVAGLVRITDQCPDRPIASAEFAIAFAAGLLTLCLDPVRVWGLLMRVDMAAVALGMMGLLVGAWANGRFWGTTMALLLCVASVFTKQTQLPVGVAVFLIALLRNPRGALYAAAIAGTFGLGALGLMEGLTGGGFLHNIVGYNINRFSLQNAFWTVWYEHTSFPFMALILMAAGATLIGQFHQRPAGPGLLTIGQRLLRLRRADRATTARAMLLLHFALASLMLFTLFKSGSSSNYLLDWLCVGCVLIGVLLCDLVDAEWRFSLVTAAIITALLIVGVANLPVRKLPDQFLVDRQAALVRRIAAAEKPVASEDMVLLMLAGKPVIFEPAIVTELASVGRWNEGPLVNMVRSGGFAFMITTDDTVGGSRRRTPAVDAAMRETYPRVEQVGPLWLHLPLR